MTIRDFASFYAAVHGRPPFSWHVRLAEQVERELLWPGTISLPTSSGKTSILDIVIFLLALRSDAAPDQRTALRTFFVVDRRLVVDEAGEHASKLVKALDDPKSAVVGEVRQGLLRFGGEVPLRVAVLRGGMYRDNGWIDAPNQPLVCLSTVDQLGSRLLFRGYQVSASQRPVHAALVANDSLVIVDEAHLSRPFLDTVGMVSGKYQLWAERPVAPGIRLMRMSATAPDDPDRFTLIGEDYENEELNRRFSAGKAAALIEAKDLEPEAAKQADRLSRNDGVNVIGVVMNRVVSARKVFDLLGGETRSILLTGRIRPHDRDRLLEEFLPRMKAGRNRSASAETLFVVATQTVEVGANLDFDALVTEAAPLDALRQRFGRLDRLGRKGSSSAVIIRRKEHGPDRVYGEALTATWDWLIRNATDGKPPSIDFGVQAMDALVKEKAVDGLSTPSESGPLLFPSHIESWVQTNPAPEPDPDVPPFLHGRRALDAEDVQIVWRADLPKDPAQWAETVALAPPTLTEALAVPVSTARRWLRGDLDPSLADVEGQTEVDEAGPSNRPVLRWRGEGSETTDQVRPGDTIVVPADYGGTDRFGWNPAHSPARDIGEECAIRARRRIHPSLLSEDHAGQLATLLSGFRKTGEGEEDLWDFLKAAFDVRRRDVVPYPDGSGFMAIRKRQPSRRRGDDHTGEDDSASFTRPITLAKHTRGVAEHARLFAEGCGLAPDLADDIELAARLHDYGKCDPRFQLMLADGVRWSREPLAKSGAGASPVDRHRKARALSGYPPGARHEMLSVALAGQSRLIASAHDRDLVLYLIGAHHGYGRAFVPVWDETPVAVRAWIEGELIEATSAHGLQPLDRGWTERFWTLIKRYGFWGLAYLESILRRADCVQSRKEEEEDAGDLADRIAV